MAAALPVIRAQTPPDPTAIVERAAGVYQGLSSYRADFTQVIADQMLGVMESRGKLVQAGTSRLSMRFSKPSGEAIVMDGSQIWIYTPSTTPGQVLKLPIPSAAEYGPNVLAWLLNRPAERYRSTYVREDSLEGLAVDVISLTPLDPQLPFTEAILWLDQQQALPRLVEIQERSGAQRTLTLLKVQINAPIATGTFRFDVPPGVRVVEQ